MSPICKMKWAPKHSKHIVNYVRNYLDPQGRNNILYNLDLTLICTTI